MENETKVAGIWKRPVIIISIAAILVVAFAVICALAINSAEKGLTEEHDRAQMWMGKAIQSNQENSDLRAGLELQAENLLQCEAKASSTLSDSVARLKTKTILITSLPAQPQGASAALVPMMEHAGMLGLLLDVVQSAQKQTGRAAPPPAQAWILPTSVEPMFAGDVDRAWVVHVDAATSKPVDQPHHPFPVQK